MTQKTPDSPAPQTKTQPVRVMIVDDSIVVRGMIMRTLATEDDIQIISTAVNGQQALDKVTDVKPDIIILDVEMPVMDGITALPELIKKVPKTKIIMCSTLTLRNAEISLKALSLGATECVAKPTTPESIGKDGEFRIDLLRVIRSLAPITPARQQENRFAFLTKGASKNFQLRNDPNAYTGKPELIAIGSSTGGPQALFAVLKHLKSIDIPIVITQHMPATFTTILAQHITQNTGIPAAEGQEGMKLERGKAYVAPGNYHMVFKKEGLFPHISLMDTPPINYCKPAIDPMMESAISIYGNKVLGVILTGMGADGLEGGRKLVNKGGRLIAQDEKTSVVWGMPGAAAMDNLCTEVLPLEKIGPWIRKAAKME